MNKKIKTGIILTLLVTLFLVSAAPVTVQDGGVKATDWTNVTITGSQVTDFNSLASSVINDTTDLINNNTDAKLEDLQVTGGLSIGSPETTPSTGVVYADDGTDVGKFCENSGDCISVEDADIIRFYQNGASRWEWTSTEFRPTDDAQKYMGSFSNRLAGLYSVIGRFNVTSEASNFPGTVLIRGKEALRLMGYQGLYLYGGQLNFGDSDYAYIREPQDDQIEIRGSSAIILNGTTKIPSIAAGAGTDYVCINTAGQLSSGASCTKFEGLQASSETLSDDQFKVKNILSRAYPSDFPLGDLRGKTKEYVYTVAFNLEGVTMEGTIKVPGNMDPVEIPYYLKQKIQAESGVNSLVESQVSSSDVGKVYGLSEVQYVESPAKAKN